MKQSPADLSFLTCNFDILCSIIPVRGCGMKTADPHRFRIRMHRISFSFIRKDGPADGVFRSGIKETMFCFEKNEKRQLEKRSAAVSLAAEMEG